MARGAPVDDGHNKPSDLMSGTPGTFLKVAKSPGSWVATRSLAAKPVTEIHLKSFHSSHKKTKTALLFHEILVDSLIDRDPYSGLL